MMKYGLPIIALTLFAATPALAGNWNVPTAARGLDNPIPINATSQPVAAEVYSRHCVSCHGEHGLGNGTEQKVEYSLQSILAVSSQPGGAPLTDGELYWKITHGVGKMPAFAGKLTDHERWLTVNHMRQLPTDPQ